MTLKIKKTAKNQDMLKNSKHPTTILLILLLTILTPSMGKDVQEEENHLIPLFLSMAVPGGGQFYNGTYLKCGIYAALELSLAGVAYAYNREKMNLEDQYDDLIAEEAASDELQRKRRSIRFYRNSRDRYIWLTAGAILLSMGDAYVDSHFKSFKKNILTKGDKLTLIPSGNKLSLIYSW